MGDPRELEPMHEAHPVRPGPGSLAAVTGQAVRPPREVESRSVVTTRPPREVTRPREPKIPTGKPPPAAPAPRLVTPPKRPDATVALPRPAFGEKGPERPRPAQPPSYEDMRRRPGTPPAPRAAAPRLESQQQRAAPPAQKPSPGAAPPAARAPREARPAQEPRALPGRPANAVSPRRAEGATAAPRKGAPSREHP